MSSSVSRSRLFTAAIAAASSATPRVVTNAASVGAKTVYTVPFQGVDRAPHGRLPPPARRIRRLAGSRFQQSSSCRVLLRPQRRAERRPRSSRVQPRPTGPAAGRRNCSRQQQPRERQSQERSGSFSSSSSTCRERCRLEAAATRPDR